MLSYAFCSQKAFKMECNAQLFKPRKARKDSKVGEGRWGSLYLSPRSPRRGGFICFLHFLTDPARTLWSLRENCFLLFQRHLRWDGELSFLNHERHERLESWRRPLGTFYLSPRTPRHGRIYLFLFLPTEPAHTLRSLRENCLQLPKGILRWDGRV